MDIEFGHIVSWRRRADISIYNEINISYAFTLETLEAKVSEFFYQSIILFNFDNITGDRAQQQHHNPQAFPLPRWSVFHHVMVKTRC